MTGQHDGAQPGPDAPAYVDAHHHIYELHGFPYKWLRPDVSPRMFGDHRAIMRDYAMADYVADLPAGLVASVHIQAKCGAADPVEETAWVAGAAAASGHRMAIVGQVFLDDNDPGAMLDRHLVWPGFRGVRAFANHDPDPVWSHTDDPELLARPQMARLAEALVRRGLSLDLIVNPVQLVQVAGLARRFPELAVIVNQLGHPRAAELGAAPVWAEGIRAMAAEPNIMLKVAGLWTIDRGWRPEVLAPFLAHAVGCFGSARCMFGSNLPVESLMVVPETMVRRTCAALALAGVEGRDDVLASTALRVYRL